MGARRAWRAIVTVTLSDARGLQGCRLASVACGRRQAKRKRVK